MGEHHIDHSFSDTFDEDIQKAVRELVEDNQMKDVDIKMPTEKDFGKNFMGQLHRLKIISKKEEKTLNLILKLSPTNSGLEDFVPIDEIFEREINLYTKIFPAFDALQENVPEVFKFRYAKCHKVVHEDKKKLLILEDLSTEGFKLFANQEPLDFTHTKLVLITLARFHALSFAMKEKNPDELNRLVKFVYMYYFDSVYKSYIEYVAGLTLSLIDDETEVEKLREFSKDIVDKFHERRTSIWAHPYNVICHADCWSNNLLFKYKDSQPVEMKMIDWQMSIFASPVTDLAHFLFCSTESSLRMDHYQEILDIYHDELGNQLKRMDCDINECYPKEIFLQHVRKVFPHGLTIAMIALPFVLCEQADEANAVDLMKNKIVKLSKRCERRLKGVVSDFVTLGLI